MYETVRNKELKCFLHVWDYYSFTSIVTIKNSDNMSSIGMKPGQSKES